MTELVLRPLTTDRVSKIADEWSQQVEPDVFESELSLLFSWCSTHTEHVEGDAHAVEVFDTVAGSCEAILEIVNGKGGRMYKLLKLYLSPKYWPLYDAESIAQQILALYAQTLSLVIDKATSDGFKELRIYGRTNDLLDILRSIESNWDSVAIDWDAIIQGRWLNCYLKNEG